MTKTYSRGSEWRRWDLHIHSPLSVLNNQYPKTSDGKPDWEAFLGRVEALDMAVLGITDYFTIDGYKELRRFKQAGRLENIDTILPNIEFRLNSVLSSRRDSKPRRLNFHVIFSDDVSPRDIEEHFLHDLHFFYEGNPQGHDETRKLKLSNIEELGNRLVAEHAEFQGRPPLMIGAMNTVVNHEEITKILRNDTRFREKYLIVFPEELYNLINWDGQDHHTRKAILQKSDMVLSSNPGTILWCRGEGPYTEGPEAFSKEFKSLKPCIHGCDAHRLSEIGVPCALRGDEGHRCEQDSESCDLRYCWIKADPTFEGLKQLLYEPKDRVRIQTGDPSPIKSQYCLRRIEIEETKVNEELKISKTTLDLSQSLVAVAGGKGSGKTALVDLIAHCYADRRFADDPNSFVQRIAEDSPGLRVALHFSDGTVFRKRLDDGTVFEDSDIVYIAQGELDRYIGDGSELAKYIRNLIFESAQIENTAKAFEFDQIGAEIEGVRKRLQQKHRVIDKLEQQTAADKTEALRLGCKKAEAEIKDVNAKIKLLEKRLSKEKLQVSQAAQDAVTALQERQEQLLGVQPLLDSAQVFLEVQLPLFKDTIAAINEALQDLSIQGVLKELEYRDEKSVADIKKKIAGALKETIAGIERENKKVKQLEAGMRQHARLLGKRTEATSRLAKATKGLEEIASLESKLAQACTDRRELFAKLLRTIVGQKKKYDEIIRVFGSKKDVILADLDFAAQLEFDEESLLQRLEDVVDKRQVEVRGRVRGESVCQTLANLYRRVTRSEEDKIDDLLVETTRLAKDLRDKLKKSYGIGQRNLYECLYAPYIRVSPAVTYKNIALNRLSLGQKGTVLIKIYLAQGQNPIIIDSHDDHLDNEFIMDELVGAIRQAKNYRQIILVSNNGNVVVNSDAEQVIVANREHGAISYSAGSIEKPEIRERALKVLEGGALAFRKRQQKYRLGR